MWSPKQWLGINDLLYSINILQPKGRYFVTLSFPSLIRISHSYKNTFFVFYEMTLSSRIMFVLFIYFNPFCCPAHGVPDDVFIFVLFLMFKPNGMAVRSMAG